MKRKIPLMAAALAGVFLSTSCDPVEKRIQKTTLNM